MVLYQYSLYYQIILKMKALVVSVNVITFRWYALYLLKHVHSMHVLAQMPHLKILAHT